MWKGFYDAQYSENEFNFLSENLKVGTKWILAQYGQPQMEKDNVIVIVSERRDDVVFFEKESGEALPMGMLMKSICAKPL